MYRAICLSGIAWMVMVATQAWAQAPDPNIVGPTRRAIGAAGEAVGAPGLEQRIENREQMRDLRRAEQGNPNAAARAKARADGNPNTTATDANPDRWRYVYHNNQWWYYTPQNQWMFYRDNNWSNYDPNAVELPRYTTGYRGPTVDSGNYYYSRRGLFGRRRIY